MAEPGKSVAAPYGVKALTRSTSTPARPAVLGATKPAHGKADRGVWKVSGVVVAAPARPQSENDCQIERPFSCGAQ